MQCMRFCQKSAGLRVEARACNLVLMLLHKREIHWRCIRDESAAREAEL